MWNFLSLSKNCHAVSEVMGQVLIAGITFSALAIVGVVLFAQEGPEYTPQIEIQQRVDASSDILYLKHSGGESLSFSDLDLIVIIDGNKKVLTEEEIQGCTGKNSWSLGDVIEIDLYKTWGVHLDSDNCVDVFLVDRGSKQLIQKATMPIEGMCSPLMNPGKWYFFTTVEGDDSDKVNLRYLHDCDPAVNFSAVPDEKYNDTFLGIEGKEYYPKNNFVHELKGETFGLTFGFRENDFKWPGAHNATILMIYSLQDQPSEFSLEIAGESMPIFDPVNCASNKWHMYNQTVPINLNSISDLKFNIHVNVIGKKSIEIDYLAVCLN
ncbi:type IV pilin N-terminal domain-containing protein [Methanosarcina sp. 1.H.T.1A.1]|uniref:type IV pilin N-terminal domain-containing protein n=1 Tax=Methanosarcina sp. 1.H.T.1A.1 TaxID=1483602 RepID=UPI000A803926|nr:type IV pilin N-terminal domain-containing protein [Methanosarcina sp. 1.H.T.1A.1]